MQKENKGKDKKNSLSRRSVWKVETQCCNLIWQSIVPSCTPSSFVDELVVVGRMPSHSIDFAWQFDFTEFDPKLEGSHLNFRVHFG